MSKSLIVADTVSRTQARYHLLETIREYALEKLDEAGETAWLRDRHLDMFLARVEEASPKLGGTYQQLWLIGWRVSMTTCELPWPGPWKGDWRTAALRQDCELPVLSFDFGKSAVTCRKA